MSFTSFVWNVAQITYTPKQTGIIEDLLYYLKTNSEWNINISGIWNIWMYNINWKKYSAMWLVTYYWLLTPVKFFNVFGGVIFGFLLDVNCILLLLANVIHNRTFYICFYFINVLYLQKYLRPIIYRVCFIWKNSNPNVRYNCRWHKLDN